MNVSIRTAGALFTLSLALAGCVGDPAPPSEPPLNTDYSNLKVADSRDVALVQPSTADDVLSPLRNGIRLSLNSSPVTAVAGLTAPNVSDQSAYSATTVQVAGVDEADLVKYDGRHIYTVRPESVVAKPGITRNVLKIARTNPATATLEVTSEFDLPGEQTSLPVIYQLQNETGAAQFIAAISQNYSGWVASSQPQATMLVALPDRTRLQLLDVRDPFNASQAWEIEFDGWLRGSRKIGNMLYLVNSYRPRLSGLILPADTQAKRESNERRIRSASAQDLLPSVRVNGGAAAPLATTNDCVVAADLKADEAYTNLLVITSIDLNERRVRDVACVSTNVNGLYVSHDSMYVGGEGSPTTPNGPSFTMLHKFALNAGSVSYSASGPVGGQLPWLNASYFMDEHDGLLRIVTSQHSASGQQFHRLSILEETANHGLALRSILPSPEHPEPIGKPGEQVHAVRFIGERAYIVTARRTDPLYAIDVSDSFDPFIAGALEIPGFSTYLQPLVVGNTDLLLSIGQQATSTGIAQGVKVELFDVTDIETPRSIGVHEFGGSGSSSEAVGDPHALTLLTMPGTPVSHRIALPMNVFETPLTTDPTRFAWTYSGFQLLEVSNAGGSIQLHVQGVLKTDESSSPSSYPSYVVPRRAILHGEAVYGVNGGTYVSSLWDRL